MFSSRRIRIIVAAMVALLTTFSLASPAFAAVPGVSRGDATFLRHNEQVNLAEITIGNIALARSHYGAVLDLATKTISDHEYAMSVNTALAAALDVTDPTMPNTQQRRVAAKLSTIDAAKFDVAYLTAQIAGHKASIAATRAEIATGTNAKVVAYAKVYLPFAEMHLKMATHALAQLG